MNTYPDTETYYVTWLGGSCGAFISMCLYILTTSDIEIKLSEFGHAHINQIILHRNYKRMGKEFSYKTIVPKFKDKPFILIGHESDIDFDYLFKKFPKCKVIIISVDDKMIVRLIVNMLYKRWTDEGDETWKNIRKTHPEMSDYDNPNNVPTELVKTFSENFKQYYKKQPFFFDKTFLPDTYKNSIFYIDFYDIIHNMSKVLAQLSEITNKPVTPFLKEQALNYQNKQIELVNSKVPWLDDK